MVDWAGLEIRSLSQDRGFESLTLLQTKRVPLGYSFSFVECVRIEPSQRVRLTARERSEHSAVKDSAKPNLEGYDRNEVKE